jgi:hypothetical protein
MPPWLDWLDWLKWDCIGAGALGKILGAWFGWCISVARKLFRWILAVIKRASALNQRTQASRRDRAIQTAYLFSPKLTKIAVSTFVTLALWIAITWQPLWSAVGVEGDRLLTIVLILTSAAWPISLLWIVFSKPKS